MKSQPMNSSQIAMSSGKHRGAAYRPYAFTEHGALLRLSTAAGEDKNIFRVKFRADRRDRPISPTRTGTLRCRIGTSSLEHGGRRRRPYAFTEHGAIMAANVLNSSRAVQMFTRLSSSQFYNELWTSSILRPCQLRRPSRELALIPEIWNAASTLHRFYDSRFTIHESRSLSAPS